MAVCQRFVVGPNMPGTVAGFQGVPVPPEEQRVMRLPRVLGARAESQWAQRPTCHRVAGTRYVEAGIEVPALVHVTCELPAHLGQQAVGVLDCVGDERGLDVAGVVRARTRQRETSGLTVPAEPLAVVAGVDRSPGPAW